MRPILRDAVSRRLLRMTLSCCYFSKIINPHNVILRSPHERASRRMGRHGSPSFQEISPASSQTRCGTSVTLRRSGTCPRCLPLKIPVLRSNVARCSAPRMTLAHIAHNVEFEQDSGARGRGKDGTFRETSRPQRPLRAPIRADARAYWLAGAVSGSAGAAPSAGAASPVFSVEPPSGAAASGVGSGNGFSDSVCR